MGQTIKILNQTYVDHGYSFWNSPILNQSSSICPYIGVKRWIVASNLEFSHPANRWTSYPKYVCKPMFPPQTVPHIHGAYTKCIYQSHQVSQPWKSHVHAQTWRPSSNSHVSWRCEIQSWNELNLVNDGRQSRAFYNFATVSTVGHAPCVPLVYSRATPTQALTRQLIDMKHQSRLSPKAWISRTLRE